MVRKTLWGGYFVLFLTALILTLKSYPIPELQSKTIALMFALFLVYSLAGLGFGVLTLFGKKFLEALSTVSTLLKFLVCLALGFSFLANFLLVLGWFFPGILNRALTLVVVGLGGTAVWFLKTGQVQSVFVDIQWPEFNFKEFILLLPATLGLGLSFFSCFSPITYYDSLVYHLALPKYYLAQQAITAVPFSLYSFFPQSVEMMFMLVLGKFMEPEYVINLLIWSFSLGCSLLIGQWANEISGRRAGVLAFLLWWTFPAVLFLSLGGYVEIPLAFFTLLSIRCFDLWSKKKTEFNWLGAAGFFSGVCFSIKYTGAITFIILFSATLYFAIRNTKILGRSMGTLLFSSFFAPSLWFLKNYLTVGNPVFPFFYRFLGYGNIGWTGESAASYFQMLTEYGAKSEVFFELLLAPWKIIHSNLSFGGGFDVLGDFGWFPILFALPMFFLFSSRKNPLKLLIFYSAAHFVFWFTTKPVLRFLIAAAPIMVLVSAVLFDQLLRASKKDGKLIFGFILGLALVSNLSVYLLVQNELGAFSVAAGIEDRMVFLRKKLPYFRSYEILEQLNTADKRTMVLGDQRTYHLHGRYLSSNLFAPSLISNICNNAQNISEIGRFFTEQNVGFVLINQSEIARLGGLRKFGFSEEGIARFSAYMEEKMLLQSDLNSIQIYTPI